MLAVVSTSESRLFRAARRADETQVIRCIVRSALSPKESTKPSTLKRFLRDDNTKARIHHYRDAEYWTIHSFADHSFSDHSNGPAVDSELPSRILVEKQSFVKSNFLGNRKKPELREDR